MHLIKYTSTEDIPIEVKVNSTKSADNIFSRKIEFCKEALYKGLIYLLYGILDKL